MPEGWIAYPVDAQKQLATLCAQRDEAKITYDDERRRRKVLKEEIDKMEKGSGKTEKKAEFYDVQQRIRQARAKLDSIADVICDTIRDANQGKLFVLPEKVVAKIETPLYDEVEQKQHQLKQVQAKPPEQVEAEATHKDALAEDVGALTDRYGVPDAAVAALRRYGLTTLGEVAGVVADIEGVPGVTPGYAKDIRTALSAYGVIPSQDTGKKKGRKKAAA